MDLRYIKDYDTFMTVNEGLVDSARNVGKAFAESGPRMMSNGDTVDPAEIVKVVDDAIDTLSYHFSSFFYFVRNFTIIYFWHHPDVDTMAVDDHMNMYICAPFIKYGLKMDPELVAAVIFHEILHVAFRHVERGQRWLASKNLSLTTERMTDNNLAADLEVNVALCKKQMITPERLVNDIKGIYLKEYAETVPPMESILEDEKTMNKLRNMLKGKGKKEGNGGEKGGRDIETTPEFDEAYVEMKNKISELVNKYGPENTVEKLRDAGIISGNNNELDKNFNPETVLTMNFMRIKSFGEFMNESKGRNEGTEGYRTKEDGYTAAIKQALSEISAAMNPNGAPGGPEGEGEGGKIKTGIKKGDLIPMNLPDNGRKGGSGTEGYGLPTNTPSGSQDERDGNKANEGGSASDGGSGETMDGGHAENTGIDIEYGGNKIGTGVFISDGSDMRKSFEDELKDTYGEYFDEISEIIKKNISRNTKEAVEEKLQKAMDRIKDNSDPVKIIWKKGIESSEKYKALWKEMLKDFLCVRSRKAGYDMVDPRHVKWFNKRYMTIKAPLPMQQKTAQDPQDINVYVDVSGSVHSNMELMELIAQSLITFLDEYKYTGINIIPWASKSTGVHRVKPIKEIGEDAAVKDILKCISDGASKCGGGTTVMSCLKEIATTTFQYEGRNKKDDAHIIITDGYWGDIDAENVENTLSNIIERVEKGYSESILENCFWMIYDNDDDKWEKSIRKGTLIKISKDNFRP